MRAFSRLCEPLVQRLKCFCAVRSRSEEHTSELQSRLHLVCRLLLEKKKTTTRNALFVAMNTSSSKFFENRISRPVLAIFIKSSTIRADVYSLCATGARRILTTHSLV